jgi:hypothetical protein
MLAGEHHLFGCARLKPSQGSVPAGLTLTSDLRICFHRQAGSSLVLRRPIETTALTGPVVFERFEQNALVLERVESPEFCFGVEVAFWRYHWTPG